LLNIKVWHVTSHFSLHVAHLAINLPVTQSYTCHSESISTTLKLSGLFVIRSFL
jgi:hypothetical protein